MQSHQLPKLNTKSKKRVGRGGKRGTYSGRGMKGQKSRSGRKIRPQIRDIIKKIHMRRGYGFVTYQDKPVVVNFKDLDKKFKDGDKIIREALVRAGLIRVRKNKKPPIKVLGTGKLGKKLVFDEDVLFSKSAKARIEK